MSAPTLSENNGHHHHGHQSYQDVHSPDHAANDQAAHSNTAHAHKTGGHTGHSEHAGHDPRIFRNRFWITLLLTISLLIYSYHIQLWFNFRPPHFPGAAYLPAVLGTVIFFYGGIVFLRSALAELRARRPGMMILISLAISVAFIYSAAVTLGLPGEELYWEPATLVAILLLGHCLEMGALLPEQA